MLLSSFTGWAHWAQKISRDDFSQALTKAVASGLSGGLLRALASDRLEVTAVGRACAAKGIGVATGAALANWVEEASAATVDDLEALLTVSNSPAGGDICVNLPRDQRWAADYRGQLLARATAAGAAARPIFVDVAANLQSLEYDFTKAIKKALLMGDWIAEVPTQDLESRYQTWAGAIRRIGEEYGWLVDALAGVARASGWSDSRSRALDVLASRLAHGVKPDVLPLARLRAPGVGRAMLRRLVDAGFSDREALRSGGPEAVAGVLKHKTAMISLWASVTTGAKNTTASMQQRGGASHAADAATPDPFAGEPGAAALVVDLRSRRVTYRGHPIPTKPPHHLRRGSVLALAVLASHAGEVVTMPDLAAGMRKLGRSGQRIVTPESREIRYQVIRPFRRALAGLVEDQEIESLVESVPGVGLRLSPTGGAQVVGAGGKRSG